MNLPRLDELRRDLALGRGMGGADRVLVMADDANHFCATRFLGALLARGYSALFARHIRQANEGCDFDFLEGGAPTPDPEIH